jgi:hypothetical protein
MSLLDTCINFCKKNWFALIFITILICAACIRFYKLGLVPQGMTWDEAAIGYNGFSVWTTRRDEWLKLLPISFQSFGDYKAPAAIYINGFFTFVFGLNLFAIRLPFTISSLFAIIAFGSLTWIVAQLQKYTKSLPLTLIAMTLFTFSPWHIHFSRAGFESGMSLSFLLLGVSLLLFPILRSKNKITLPVIPKIAQHPFFVLFVSAAFLVASMYTYHSAKIVAPLVGLLVVIRFNTYWKKRIAQLIFIAICSILFLIPMAHDSIYGEGAARLEQTSILAAEGSFNQKVGLLATNMAAHFSPTFLVLGDTPNLRHGAGTWGVLLPTTFIFFAISFFFLLQRKKKSQHTSIILFFIAWIIIGLLPAGLGIDEIPHSNRALLALPGFLGLAALGLVEFIQLIEQTKQNKTIKGNHGETNSVRDAVIGSIVLLHAIFFLSFMHHYFTNFAAQASSDYQDGYLETLDIVTDYEYGRNNKPEVSKIIFSDEYGQPYIYALVARKTSPLLYQGGSLIKYEFKNPDVGDLQRTNALIVSSNQDLEEFPVDKADHIIYGTDGSIRFHLYYLP